MIIKLKSCKRLLVAGLALWIVFTGCAQPSKLSSAPEPTDENVLRVGVSTNSPPFVFKQSGEIVGLDAELAKEFARFIERKLRFVELKWNDQIPALLKKRTDIIMSGMTITKMREMRIAFSSPYYQTGQMAVVRKENQNRFPAGYYGILGQSPNMRFGVVKGTTGEMFVRKYFDSAKKITAYSKADTALDALLTPVLVNRIDILVHDGPILLMLLAKKQSAELTVIPSLLTEEDLAWGIRKTDPELLNSANRFIDDLRQSGKLAEMTQRWIPYAK
jgi:polar amino acid transport system substrate-binding protein